eukprot:6194116-Pleurochrysis_carterae.AAC.2
MLIISTREQVPRGGMPVRRSHRSLRRGEGRAHEADTHTLLPSEVPLPICTSRPSGSRGVSSGARERRRASAAAGGASRGVTRTSPSRVCPCPRGQETRRIRACSGQTAQSCAAPFCTWRLSGS